MKSQLVAMAGQYYHLYRIKTLELPGYGIIAHWINATGRSRAGQGARATVPQPHGLMLLGGPSTIRLGML